MDSIVNRLTEIEDAASAIVRHAEEEKEILDQEYDKKRKAFDDELEKKTKERLDAIRAELEKKTTSILEGQNEASDALIRSLQQEYEEKHTEYAHEILRHITEV